MTRSRSLIAVLATAAVAGASVGGASLAPAAKKPNPNSGPTSSIVLNQSAAALGSTVTFTVAYPRTAKNPRITVRCWQNGEMTYAEGGAVNYAFTLGGGWSMWKANGGAADCTAELADYVGYGAEIVPLASTSFHAAG